jgi:TonB family protein
VTDRVYRTVRSVSGFKGSFSLAALALLFCLTAICAPEVLAQNAPKPHRKVIVMFDPEYPAVLKNGHFEGQVRIDATVLPNGTVSKVEIKGGNPILAQCASQAVMRWKYAPASAQTVEEVTFNFNSNNR